MPKDHNPTAEAIFADLDVYSRGPFLETLANLLACEPKPAAIKRFANKYPDRWAQSIAIMARLGGYSEKIQVDKTITLAVKSYSDMELDHEILKLRREIAALESQASGALIEGECLSASSAGQKMPALIENDPDPGTIDE